MRRYMRSPWMILVLCLAVLVVAATAVHAYQCNYYSTNAKLYDPGYGSYCGGWGDGCTVCWDGTSGAHCVEGGFEDCLQPENRN